MRNRMFASSRSISSQHTYSLQRENKTSTVEESVDPILTKQRTVASPVTRHVSMTYPWSCALRWACQHFCRTVAKKYVSGVSLLGNVGQTQIKGHFTEQLAALFRSVKVMKEKERHTKELSPSDESKELWQTNTLREPGLGQGPVLGTLVGYQWDTGENPMSFIDSAFSKCYYLVSTCAAVI